MIDFLRLQDHEKEKINLIRVDAIKLDIQFKSEADGWVALNFQNYAMCLIIINMHCDI